MACVIAQRHLLGKRFTSHHICCIRVYHSDHKDRQYMVSVPHLMNPDKIIPLILHTGSALISYLSIKSLLLML